MKELTRVCDRCGGTEFGHPDTERHPRIIAVFGPEVFICGGCGAFRYDNEIPRMAEIKGGAYKRGEELEIQ